MPRVTCISHIIHMSLWASVCTIKIQATSGRFHGILLESSAQLFCPMSVISEMFGKHPKVRKIWETVENIFQKVLLFTCKILGNFQRCLENLGKLSKCFEQMLMIMLYIRNVLVCVRDSWVAFWAQLFRARLVLVQG